jgi:hypothetical protein
MMCLDRICLAQMLSMPTESRWIAAGSYLIAERFKSLSNTDAASRRSKVFHLLETDLTNTNYIY